MSRRPVLIAGPTASGKSALALRRAAETPSVIVNADSMQVYAELRILTARPDAAEEQATPHRLYGHVPAAERYSVGRWLEDVAAVLATARAEDRRPIVVGGTGLYFRALTQGLADVPPIPADVRTAIAEHAAGRSTAELHRELRARSASEAARLRPSDRARILRSLEVLEATGRALPEWQATASRPLLDPVTAERIVIVPERAELHRRIDARFAAMVEAGAIGEASAMMALALEPTLPAMKAIGLRPLMAHLRGELPLPAAIAAAQAETRQYAKRQLTWFRHQMPGWQTLDAIAL